MSETASDSGLEEPTLIEPWSPEGVEADLELGFAAHCEECDTSLRAHDCKEASLVCPDCGLDVGFVVQFPDVSGDRGEPGAEPDWPAKRTHWEIEDGRATVSYFVRGTHTECDAQFVEDDHVPEFGTPGGATCKACHAKLGFAMTANILNDPLEDDS